MNETRRKPTTGRQFPSLCDKWHGIFYMPRRIYRRGWTYQGLWLPSRGALGGKPNTYGPESSVLPTEPPRFPRGSHNPGSSTGGGDLLPTGGIVGKEQPRHEKVIPMGPCVSGLLRSSLKNYKYEKVSMVCHFTELAASCAYCK